MKKLWFAVLLAALVLCAMQWSALAADRDLTVRNFVVPAADSAAHPVGVHGAFAVTRTVDFAAEAGNCNTNDTLVLLWLADGAVPLYATCGSPDGFNTTNAVTVTPKYWNGSAWANIVDAQSISTNGVTSLPTTLLDGTNQPPAKFGITLNKVPAEGEYSITVFGYTKE